MLKDPDEKPKRKLGSIYLITNQINGKVYVGQTIKKIKRRFDEHSYKCYSNRKSAIGEAIRKYGKDNFTIEEIDSALDINELNKKEIFWIAAYNKAVLLYRGYGYYMNEICNYEQ